MTKVRSEGHVRRTVPALLATASMLALVAGMSRAAADDCAAKVAPPANLATPSMVYETLSARTNAQLLAMGFLRKPVEQACAWIYEVRLMTASGSVVELDFNADGLALVGARGPRDDRDAADLVKTLGGDSAVLNAGGPRVGARGKDGETASGSDDGGGSGGEGGDGGNSGGGSGSGGGEGGEGGNSGSGGGDGGGGSGGSGGGGDSGGEGGDGGGEGGDGGGGDGGGGDGGGEGGDGGGDD